MINRIRIQNYKSIIDVTVDLSPITVLVGRSGTGKSNFVEAIRCLRDVLTSRQQMQNLQENWSQIKPAMSVDSSISFDIAFSVSGISEQYRYQLTLGPQCAPIFVQEERLEFGSTCIFHQTCVLPNQGGGGGFGFGGQSPKWIVEPALLQVPPAGPLALGRIPAISEAVIAFTALTTGIGCYTFPDKVLSGARTNERTSGLNDDGTNFLDTLKEIVSNLQDFTSRRNIVSALQRVNSSVSSIELNDLQNPAHVVVGHKFGGKTLGLQLSQESDGFRRFYAHLLALYQRPPKQTLVFEHPEDGIHPGALSLLAEEFLAAPENNRGQVILTTHSPGLLDQFDVNQMRVVELDDFHTRISPVSDVQRESIRDHLLTPGELLTVDPARSNAVEAETSTLCSGSCCVSKETVKLQQCRS